MMGRTHAVSGAATWLAMSPALPTAGALEATVGALVCAGAALLPDLDHPRATLARSVPIAGGIVAGALGALSGGHRQGLHSLLAVTGCGLLAGFVSVLIPTIPGQGFAIPAGAALLLAATLAFASRSLRLVRNWWQAWLVAGLLALATSWLIPDLTTWLPIAIVVGYAAHIAGDALTVGGVPLLWPLRIRTALPVLGRTGSVLEALFGIVLTLFTLVVLWSLWSPLLSSTA